MAGDRDHDVEVQASNDRNGRALARAVAPPLHADFLQETSRAAWEPPPRVRRENVGKVPEENRPGHHPEKEQDKPSGAA
jgi:hypothetical protein